MRDRELERNLIDDVLAGRISRRTLVRRGAIAGLSMGTLSTMLAACGGSDDEGAAGGGDGESPAVPTKLSSRNLTLSFLWFEWPPATSLEEFANDPDNGYVVERPNVKVQVDTVPIERWHDLIFTQFGAQRTDFTIPVLDSQFLGEAVVSGHILDLTSWIQDTSGIDLDAYNSYLLAAYGQYPQTTTGELDLSGDAKLYGLPLLGDTWTMMWRKDLMDKAPETWDEMIQVATQLKQEEDMGLGFHQQGGGGDAAAVTFNTVLWIHGGELWNAEDRQVEGILNNDKGKQAMDILVNQMTPAAPNGSANWFIPEVNNAFNQGQLSIGLNWVAAVAGNVDPELSTLGKSQDEILEKVGFAVLPQQETDAVPLGGMGLHVSNYVDDDLKAEALNFIKWFEQPEQQLRWAEVGGVPARTDALNSPEFLDGKPWNQTYTDSVERLRDFWNLPEYAQMLEVQNVNVNAAITGTKDPIAALDEIAQEQQAILDGGI